MIRADIIKTIGRKYLVSNIENGEFSYPKSIKELGIEYAIEKTEGQTPQYLDLRFTNDRVSVLIETKHDFMKDLEGAKQQLAAYVRYEKEITDNKIIAILANTSNDSIKVWRGTISDEDFLEDEYKLKTFEEYAEYYTNKTNDKEKVMRNTY